MNQWSCMRTPYRHHDTGPVALQSDLYRDVQETAADDVSDGIRLIPTGHDICRGVGYLMAAWISTRKPPSAGTRTESRSLKDACKRLELVIDELMCGDLDDSAAVSPCAIDTNTRNRKPCDYNNSNV